MEMDFLDYGDNATCRHLQDTFSRYSNDNVYSE